MRDEADNARRAEHYDRARRALGLSKEGLARRLDISLSTSNRYASGASKVPTNVLELLDRLVAERAAAKPARSARKKRGA